MHKPLGHRALFAIFECTENVLRLVMKSRMKKSNPSRRATRVRPARLMVVLGACFALFFSEQFIPQHLSHSVSIGVSTDTLGPAFIDERALNTNAPQTVRKTWP